MKKALFASLAILCTAGTVSAAGLFDGIYKDPRDDNSYVSVHQNGTRLIVTEYSTRPLSNTSVPTILGNFLPSRIDHWNLLSGTISGNRASVAGEVEFGACFVGVNIGFDASSLVLAVSSASDTAIGVSQGLRCQSLNSFLSSQNPVRYPKIF